MREFLLMTMGTINVNQTYNTLYPNIRKHKMNECYKTNDAEPRKEREESEGAER